MSKISNLFFNNLKKFVRTLKNQQIHFIYKNNRLRHYSLDNIFATFLIGYKNKKNNRKSSKIWYTVTSKNNSWIIQKFGKNYQNFLQSPDYWTNKLVKCQEQKYFIRVSSCPTYRSLRYQRFQIKCLPSAWSASWVFCR